MHRNSPSAPTLKDRPWVVRWLALGSLTAAIVALLEFLHLPAAFMLGALIAAIIFSVHAGHVRVAPFLYVAAQGLIGCLIARSIGRDILGTMAQQWPTMLAFVFAVILFSTVLGGLLAYWRVLPGTTAIWGSSPGGASVMVIMSESFGADIRLVAFMQFLRVAVVAAVASAVSRIWLPTEPAAAVTIVWFPHVDGLSLMQTLSIAFAGAWLGGRMRLPAGAMLLPMFIGIALSGLQVVSLTLPPWLMLSCYAVVGWTIGLRFTREVVKHAARAFPRILASTGVLVALCGVLAYLLHIFTGVDPLTAYLATSPGGADSVAIIAASSHVDIPFVMALQTGRFMVVLLIGPTLAQWVSRLIHKHAAPLPVQNAQA